MEAAMHLIQLHGINPIVPLTPKMRSFPKSHVLTDRLIKTLAAMLPITLVLFNILAALSSLHHGSVVALMSS